MVLGHRALPRIYVPLLAVYCQINQRPSLAHHICPLTIKQSMSDSQTTTIPAIRGLYGRNMMHDASHTNCGEQSGSLDLGLGTLNIRQGPEEMERLQLWSAILSNDAMIASARLRNAGLLTNDVSAHRFYASCAFVQRSASASSRMYSRGLLILSEMPRKQCEDVLGSSCPNVRSAFTQYTILRISDKTALLESYEQPFTMASPRGLPGGLSAGRSTGTRNGRAHELDTPKTSHTYRQTSFELRAHLYAQQDRSLRRGKAGGYSWTPLYRSFIVIDNAGCVVSAARCQTEEKAVVYDSIIWAICFCGTVGRWIEVCVSWCFWLWQAVFDSPRPIAKPRIDNMFDPVLVPTPMEITPNPLDPVTTFQRSG